MKSLKKIFKKEIKRSVQNQRHIITGNVEFVNGSVVKEGVIFGKPIYPEGLYLGRTEIKYYIRTADGKVYKVEENAIEEKS